jgi:hypothetical protein
MSSPRPRGAAATAPDLRECKVRASILLKDLRSDEPDRARSAAARFGLLPHFEAMSAESILARRGAIRRKHALAVVAAEQGFESWSALKAAMTPRFDVEAAFRAGINCGCLNRWFTRYDEARESLRIEGGYLFPFRTQFFLCESGFIEAMGLDPADPDWERIGRDWVEPRDPAARERIERRLIALGFTA